MKPGKLNLAIYPGRTLHLNFELLDENGIAIDLTGCTAQMQVRSKYRIDDPPILDLSTENGGIELSVGGTIEIIAPKEDTAELKPLVGSAMIYDLALTWTNSEEVSLLEGNMDIKQTVTP